MIKKLLKGIFVSLLFGIGIINFSNGYYTAYIDEVQTNRLYTSTTINPDKYGNFNASDGTNNSNVLYVMAKSYNNTYLDSFSYFFYDSNNIKYYQKLATYTIGEGTVTKWRISTADDIPNLDKGGWEGRNNTWLEVQNSGLYGYVDKIYYNDSYVTNSAPGNSVMQLCFVSTIKNISACTKCTAGIGNSDCSDNGTGYDIRDTGMTNTYFSYLDSSRNALSSLGGEVVSGGGGGGGGTSIPVNSDVDYAINYYESTKGFNKNMCYVGTNDLSADYGASGISFENGTGATIFELYYSLYSGYGSNIITNVGKFINVRTLNYGQWFYNRDNILWLATDNGPDSNVTYIYTGFTFPFANKPVGIYFMASNLMEQYFSESSMGNDVSYYCYIKLNYSSIESGSISYTGDVLPLVPDPLVNNVDDYVKYQLNYGESGYYLGLDWNNSYTGEYQLTDNLELDNVFISFVDKLNSKLGNISISYSIGIIPDWILYPLIFLILFRIMKH